jgi:PAS domain S-box-containing protein
VSQKRRFDLAMRGTDFGFWDVDIAKDEVHWWNDWCATVDIDPCLGPDHSRRWDAQIHPEDSVRIGGYYELLAGRCELYETEYRLRTRTGAWRWVASRGRVTVRNADGTAARVTGVTIDIDARKRHELASSRTRSRVDAAVWGDEVGLWESDGDGGFRWFNDWCTPFGIDRCEGPGALERWRSLIHPDDLLRFDLANEEARGGLSDFYVVEYRMRTRAGEWRWVHERGRVTEREASGRESRAVGVCIDIDARKRTEIALRDSEARLETAIGASDLGLWDWNVRTDEMVWLSNWPRRYGIAVDSTHTRRTDWLARLHPNDRERHAADDAALAEPGRDSDESDYLVRSADGAWRWINVRKRVIERSETGRPLRVVGACIDVDERRRGEHLLRAQASILETMREGVLLIDAEGRIEFTNPAFDRMFGRRAGELRGSALLELVHPRPRAGRSPSLMRLLQRFHARSNERTVTFRRADGTGFAGQVLSATIEHNGTTKSLVVVQDISERKRLEQEITEAASRERRRLGSDLHDGLGQELTGISLLLRSFANQIGRKDEAVVARLDEIIGLVNHAIESARTLALGLSPVTPARDGFVAALGSLATWSRSHFGIEVRLRLNVPYGLRIDEASATHLYLIAQEAILNAVKHGRASCVEISLRAGERIIRLGITDDGGGLRTNPAATTGMGLKIMQYRAGMLGGSLRIENRKSGGARVRCLCPQPPLRVKANGLRAGHEQQAPYAAPELGSS